MTAAAPRILVIEDEPGIRGFASRALSAAGFTVALAARGDEGLAAARGGHFGSVLLDLGLPDLAGEEVLQRLRRQQPDLPVVVWSATADRDARRRCLLLGARAFLPKPVPVAELLQCITAPARPAVAPGPGWPAAKPAGRLTIRRSGRAACARASRPGRDK